MRTLFFFSFFIIIYACAPKSEEQVSTTFKLTRSAMVGSHQFHGGIFIHAVEGSSNKRRDVMIVNDEAVEFENGDWVFHAIGFGQIQYNEPVCGSSLPTSLNGEDLNVSISLSSSSCKSSFFVTLLQEFRDLNPVTPIILSSTENQNFTITASGSPPFAYTWLASPGDVIESCTGASCLIGAGSLAPGIYTIAANVVDSAGLSTTSQFSIIINSIPEINSIEPDNMMTVKMDCSTSKVFELSFDDINFQASQDQAHTVTWLLNGNLSDTLSATLDTSTSPMISTAIFSPNCMPSLLGDQEIIAIVSDGIEQVQTTWNVRSNYFSDVCNNLLPSHVCSLAGTPGMPVYQLPADAHRVRVFPRSVRADGSHGYFIVDERYRSVWYYNVSSAPRTILNITVAPGQMRIVAGNGGDGQGVAGQNSLEFAFRDPFDVAFSSTGELYVADYLRRQIIKFDSNGLSSIFAGGGFTSPQGGSRTNHMLANITVIELDEANDRLFATSHANNANGGVKAFSLSTDEGWLIVPSDGNNNAEGTLEGTATIARGAHGLARDPNDSILFASDLYRCQVMALNYGAESVSYYGGDLVVPPGEMRLLTLNGGNCADTATDRLWNDGTSRLRTHFLAPYTVAGQTRGLFITDTNRHHIIFLNFTDASIELGGQTIAAKSHHRIYGVYNSANYGRATPAHISSYLNSPRNIDFNESLSQLVISDRSNFRVASLATNTANGSSGDLVGFKGGFDDDSNKHAQERLFYGPRGLAYDDLHNKLWVLDDLNQRIRSIDLMTGQVKTEIGTGLAGASNTNPEQPLGSTIRFRTLSDISVDPNTGEVLYTERQGGGNNQNQNCLIRSYNPLVDSDDFWGITIPGNRVSTVVGNYARGCGVWQAEVPNNAPVDGDSAISFRIDDPYGIAAMRDRSRMYFSMRNRHYIMSVDDIGVLRHEFGSYNSAGTSDGPLASVTLDFPGDLELDSDSYAADCGNFFIVDRSLMTNSRIRYVNRCASALAVAGVNVPSNHIVTIHNTTIHSFIASVASFDSQICYTRGHGGLVNINAQGVLCFSRESGAVTLAIGLNESGVIKGGIPIGNANEGVQASSAMLFNPYGIVFDSEGNLYFVDFESVKMVRRWW
jgi:hypothetical protein